VPAAPLPDLPAGTPPAWSVRHPDPSDAPSVFELVAACDIAVLGHADIALGDIVADLAVRPDVQAVVVEGGRARVWVRVEDKAAGRTVADVFVDPGLTDEEGDALAAWGWSLVRREAATIAAGRGRTSTEIETGTLEGDRAAERRAAAAGLTRCRTFWRMHRPITAADADPQIATGVAIRRAAPEEAPQVHALIEAAFADHWNHHPRTFDEWWTQRTTSNGYDPDLWWLAEVDGRPAGVLIATRQMADENAMYVGIVATAREARGRGVGSSLLRTAFAAALAQGWAAAKLDVDSDSPTSAPSVYAGVGLEVAFAMHAWQADVPAVARELD
jgi:mycothiol synthase